MSVRSTAAVTRNVPIIQTGEVKYPRTKWTDSGQRFGATQSEAKRRDFLWNESKNDSWSTKKDDIWNNDKDIWGPKKNGLLTQQKDILWDKKRDDLLGRKNDHLPHQNRGNQNKDDHWKHRKYEGTKHKSINGTPQSSLSGTDGIRRASSSGTNSISNYGTNQRDKSDGTQVADGTLSQKRNVWSNLGDSISNSSTLFNQWRDKVGNERRATSVPISSTLPSQYRASSLPPLDNPMKEKEKWRRDQRRNTGLDLSSNFRRPRQCEHTIACHHPEADIKKVNNLQRAVSENFLSRLGEDRSNLYVTREVTGQDKCQVHKTKGTAQSQVKTKKMELKFGMETLKTPAILKMHNILPKDETPTSSTKSMSSTGTKSTSSTGTKSTQSHRKITPYPKSTPPPITDNRSSSVEPQPIDNSINQPPNNRDLRRRALEQKLVNQNGDIRKERLGIFDDTLEGDYDTGDEITYNIKDGREGITLTTPSTSKRSSNFTRGQGRWSLREPNSSKPKNGINRTKSNDSPRFGSLRGLPPLWPSISSIPSYFRRPSLPDLKVVESDPEKQPTEKACVSILKHPGVKKSAKKHVEFVDMMDTKQPGARHY